MSDKPSHTTMTHANSAKYVSTKIVLVLNARICLIAFAVGRTLHTFRYPVQRRTDRR